MLRPGKFARKIWTQPGNRQSATQTTDCMQQASDYELHKTLGHWTKPHPHGKSRVKKQLEKSDKEAKKLELRKMQADDAWTHCCAVHSPKATFPMHVSFYSLEECETIQQRAMHIFLARCGHNRRCGRAIAFGPKCLGGHSFQHLCCKQGTNMMQFFLQQWQTPGQLNDLLHVAVSWCQVNTGFGTSFLTNVETKAPHFESKFLKTIRDFLKCMNGRIESDWDHVPKTQCKNNQHLMDTTVQQLFTDTEMTQINCM